LSLFWRLVYITTIRDKMQVLFQIFLIFFIFIVFSGFARRSVQYFNA